MKHIVLGKGCFRRKRKLGAKNKVFEVVVKDKEGKEITIDVAENKTNDKRLKEQLDEVILFKEEHEEILKRNNNKPIYYTGWISKSNYERIFL